MPTRRVSLLVRFYQWIECRHRLLVAARLLLIYSFFIGCSEDGSEGRGGLTAPGSSTPPDIRGVYSAPNFWSFEAIRLADGEMATWNCRGRVTISRQTFPDFPGTFLLTPPDPQRCEMTTGNLSGGVVRNDGRILFATSATGQDPDVFFALPDCVVVGQDPLWTGRVIGDRFVASTDLTVDCPADVRLRITGRAEGSRTATSD